MLNTSAVPKSGALQTLSGAKANALLNDWRMTPATMMSKLDPTWIPAKWLQYLSFKIASCISRGKCGLLISAPPRHGKSMLSTIATPLWVLENFPNRNVVVATYGEDLSTDFSRQIRDHIQNNQDLLSVRLRADTQRVTNFLTTRGGGLKAVGLRGTITGRGANVLVLDDYIKEPKEAMSPTYLEDLWTWWLTVARTRLEPGAVVIILATRWVAKDLHGRIMQRQQETGRSFFEYVELPAIAGEGDVLGRKPGEVLFPERYDQEEILALKDELGTRWFNAMFQQQPDSDENAVISAKWFKRIKMLDYQLRIQAALNSGQKVTWARFWDMASTKEAGDYTSGALCAYIKDTDEFFIVHIKRGQYSAAKAEAVFGTWSASDVKEYGDSYKMGMEQEPGSSGKYSVRHFQTIAREFTSRPSIKLHEAPATTSKLLNAQPFLASAEAGKTYIIDDDLMDPNYKAVDGGLGWVRDFFNEVEDFPEGAHDDQIDSLSGAYKLLTGKKFVRVSVGRQNEPKLLVTAPKLVDSRGNSLSKNKSSITFGRKRT